ncbi:MAG: ABC transporter ATP-binding protein [Acidobacteriota bacterium]|nr:ABC transporter ATP-binding protein [Acidobacteriota bacterium]
MISCAKLTKQYGQVTAVSDATFDVPAGTICTLLGTNGAGKSTTIKMFTGLIAPTSGSAQICGTGVQSPRIRSLIGVLPEDLALFDLLTVKEHLELTGAVYKVGRRENESRTAQLLRVLRLDQFRDTFLHQCSYGTKKKTALAMALLPNPQVLFLDEPFEGVDPVTSDTLRCPLRALAAKRVTILLTSHILSLVDRVADSVILINHGKIVWKSLVSELPKGIEDLYFDLVERPGTEELDWLGQS